ncbi:MAG TPA: preprotein translocase subunit SecE [candidate division Zixibacteria bacterium]|nr:preprotein translocase subunit SecE [candidate division Zixibacteria bacterium]
MFDKVKKFFNDVYIELQKVAWPSKEELMGSTAVVILMSVIMAVFVGVVDKVLNLFVNILIRIGGS